MYFKTISLDSVPIHVLADQFTTFLTLFNSLWLNFSFVLSLRMSSYLSRSQKKFSSILHGWFFFLSVILYFLTDIRIGCFFYLSFDNTCWKRKSIPEIFCVRWRRTQFIIFWVLCFEEWLFLRVFRRSSAVSATFWLSSYVICAKTIAHRGFHITLRIVERISKDYVVVFIMVYGW